MLDDSERDGMYVPIGHVFSRPGFKWCVVKIKESKNMQDDDLRTVGDIVYITKTEAAANRVKRQRAKGCYKAQMFGFEGA